MLAARLEGRWLNTLEPERNLGIDRVQVKVVDERAITIALEIIGVDGPATWGPVRCEVFECWEEDHVPGAAALGVVELDEAVIELQLRVNKGILCVMSWTRFREPGRHAWNTRELFARALEESP
jgi:hypothetical protein